MCRRLNQLALDYARESVPADILARFARFHGAPLAAADDAGPYNSGPSWYYTPLKFKPMKDDTGRVVRVDAVSATLRTSTRYLIPAVRGVHYCKLLSPARALEWLYTDGLRFNKGMTVVAA